MSNFMIACVLLNISKNNSGLKGITNTVIAKASLTIIFYFLTVATSSCIGESIGCVSCNY